MKIIISHDVDHLCPSDHLFHDLFFLKLWIRSIIELFQGKINIKNLFHRFIQIFDDRLNRIPEVIKFDKLHNIPSVFFFGMANTLGMSYKKEFAKPWIDLVLDSGLDAGVHGVEINDISKMKIEFNDFLLFSGLTKFGIRTHYVRYNKNTFKKMSILNYIYDTSEFNKQRIELRPPYKIGSMWEFPLHIMDKYILKNGFESAQQLTISSLQMGIKNGLNYFTFLFHDYLFNEKTYPMPKKFYEWFVNYCIQNNLEFISYRDAIAELEKQYE